jgi:eukaryotic-like serine/threonine-protein kinase
MEPTTEPIESLAPAPPREAWFGMQTGTVLADRYRIERLISRGGMGAVFEATQLGLDRAVAIKVLLPALSRDEKVQERFRREARSVAHLRHPHIIQIYDYGISEHGPYIVMEFVRGESLREMLRRAPLELQTAVVLMEQICSALAVAHAAGIIHRDLKPDNILIEEWSGGQLVAKVLDFGIAKIREAQTEEADTSLTGANIIGSPAYMSPEQGLGQELDERSDIYSLGIVLYEMLTQAAPFAKSTPGTMLMHHVNTPPRRLRDLRRDVSPAIEAAVMKTLAKDPAQRFGSATEFAQALRLAYEDAAEYEIRYGITTTLDMTDSFATATTPRASSGTTSLTGTNRRRLAILPLRNLTGDAEIDFLGFALADSVITQLAPLKSLIVRPSSAIEKYRNQVVDPRTVGRDLQVDTILSGSYLKAGNSFRVNVQLIDVLQNEILWQERIDSQFENVIALQDKICEELIRGLRLKISAHEQEAIHRDEAHNPIAYELYLRGLAWGNSAEEQKNAIEVLHASVNLDPSYAPAWAALAGRYINARGYQRDEAMFDRAEAAARRALEINPQLPAALFWLAVYHGERGDLQAALVTCKQLLKVAPNTEYAYQAMGHAYDYAGLPDIALTLFRKAAEINPTTYPYMFGFVLYQKGLFAEARQELSLRRENVKEMAYWLAVIDYVEGNRDAAAQRLEELLHDEDEGWFNCIITALLCAIKGERERGQKALNEILASGQQLGGYYFFMMAEIYAQLGDVAMSLEMIRGAIKTGYANYPFLMADPLLAPAREAEGFAEIAQAMQQLQTQVQLMLVTG